MLNNRLDWRPNSEVLLVYKKGMSRFYFLRKLNIPPNSYQIAGDLHRKYNILCCNQLMGTASELPMQRS